MFSRDVSQIPTNFISCLMTACMQCSDEDEHVFSGTLELPSLHFAYAKTKTNIFYLSFSHFFPQLLSICRFLCFPSGHLVCFCEVSRCDALQQVTGRSRLQPAVSVLFFPAAAISCAPLVLNQHRETQAVLFYCSLSLCDAPNSLANDYS